MFRVKCYQVLLLTGLMISSCGKEDSSSEQVSKLTTEHIQEKLAIQPSPGADIDPKILDELEQSQPTLLTSGTGNMLDLGADRPIIKIDIPKIKQSSSAQFTFADNKKGWITRLPYKKPLPSVAYGKGRIYSGAGFNSYAFLALDARNGKVLWHRPHLEDNGPTAPSYLDEEVIFNTESCTLFVLNARTGKTKWLRWLGDPTLAQPATAHGLIFASYPKKGAQFLGAYRIKNGKPTWSHRVSGELLTAPVVDQDAVYVTTIHGTVYRFHAKTGKPHWVQRIRATSAPYISKGKVYLSIAKRSKKAKEEWIVALDSQSGKMIQAIKKSVAHYLTDVPRSLRSWPKVWAFEGSRPLLSQGRLMDTMAGIISATHPEKGHSLWQRKDHKEKHKRSFTPPIVAGSQLIFASHRGEVYALDIDTGMTVWAYDIGEKISASPIVAQGWLYLSTAHGAVVALNVGNDTLDDWPMWGKTPGHNG